MTTVSRRGLSRLRALARRGSDRRVGQVRPSHAECDLCAEPIGDAHRHLLDVMTGDLSCVCTACGILFDHQVSGGGHYRLVRSDQRELDLNLDDVTWAGLGVPVDLAFFVRSGESGEITAFYPSAMGTTRATPDPVVWQRVTDRNPEVAALEDDVEALLVYRRSPTTPAYWKTPIDECYRLIALLRAHWTGFSGGSEVWRQVDEFFAGMRSGVGRGNTMP